MQNVNECGTQKYTITGIKKESAGKIAEAGRNRKEIEH